MPRAINLTEVQVTQIRINVDADNNTNGRMEVYYRLVTDTGEIIEPNRRVTFWQSMPPQAEDPDGTLIPYPDNWYTVPPAGLQEIGSFINRLESALAHLVTTP